MARDAIPLALGEAEAFQKLKGGIQHSIEACCEISVLRSDANWMIISLALEKMLVNSEKLFTNAASRVGANLIRG